MVALGGLHQNLSHLRRVEMGERLIHADPKLKNLHGIGQQQDTWKESQGVFDIDEIGIYEPMDAPELSSSTLSLINRVNNLEKDSIRLDSQPDYKMLSDSNGRRNFKIGRRALFLLKQATGITLYKTRKNIKDNWNRFRKEQMLRNSQKE